MQHEIHVASSLDELGKMAAQDFARQATEAVDKRGRFFVVLSGGSTPVALFRALVMLHESNPSLIPWSKIWFFWGDERVVPQHHSQSNYAMAEQHLLSKVPVERDQVVAFPTHLKEPDLIAEAYEKAIRQVFHDMHAATPQFDLVYLGLGADGHTASLFPGSEIVDRLAQGKTEKRIVISSFIETLNSFRVTLTPSVINDAPCVTFLVAGADKSAVVKRVIKGPFDPKHLPAQLILPLANKIVWYLDNAAAAVLR